MRALRRRAELLSNCNGRRLRAWIYWLGETTPHKDVMTKLLTLLLALALLVAAAPLAAAQPHAEQDETFLPLVSGQPRAPSRLGVDLRSAVSDASMPYVAELAPRWARAGDLLWAEVEPVRGAYDWRAAAGLEANIRRIRAAGAEPIVVIQWTPPWAQRVPGRLCSPPAPEHVADLARFVAEAARRYADGPLAVHYWQIWNEPDFLPQQVNDEGSGCWATTTAPYYGGDSYGEALGQLYPAIKAANPRATVLAGGLAHFWPNETQTIGFLRGMLAAGGAFDVLTFSAYGMYKSADRVVWKANSLRRELAAFGQPDKPLLAAEVGAVCFMNNVCQPDYRQYQADYAARVYAVALALNLEGALWYTLAAPEPGFQHSHLIADSGGTLAPWPAFYALRNAALLLRGARPVGPPPLELDESQAELVQRLDFGTDRGALHVLWVPKTGASQPYALVVRPGARATCTAELNRPTPATWNCSDTDGNGLVTLRVGSGAAYVEVAP
jgi:hypothetical protein